MKRGHREVLQLFTRQRFDTLFHFARGFIRKGQRKDRALRNAFIEHVRDAIRDDSRFTASRSGDNQNRTCDRRDGAKLFGIEFRFQCMYVELGHGAQCITRNALCASNFLNNFFNHLTTGRSAVTMAGNI